jgi:hypothetical protein
MKKTKIREWLRRYIPAEIIGTITAVGAAGVSQMIWGNPVLSAYAGSFGEELGFYSTMLIQNMATVRQKNRAESKNHSFADFSQVSRGMMLEFGPAGIIDGLLLRPLFMYIFPLLMNNFALGIFVGKIAGDIAFYSLVILSYETKKKQK